VNGVLARLSDMVRPGDVVEVVTGRQRITPSTEWLNYGNAYTGRLVRGVLATVALRRAAEEGRQRVKETLARKGLLALEDVRALESDKWDNLLERLACVNLDDLFAAVGGGAVQMEELEKALDSIGINKATLHWTTISLVGTGKSHRPGVLSRLAGMVSNHGGNILRSVNNTLPEGGFELRLVINGLNSEKEQFLKRAYQESGIEFLALELV